MIENLQKTLRGHWEEWGMTLPIPQSFRLLKIRSQPQPVIWIVFDQTRATPVFAIKMSWDPSMNPYIRREYDNLAYFYDRASATLKESIPKPYLYNEIEGLGFFVQSGLCGVIIPDMLMLWDVRRRLQFKRRLARVENWLIQFQRDTCSGKSTLGILLQERHPSWIGAFRQSYQLTGDEVRFLDGLLERLEELKDDQISVTGMHGDFFVENALFSNRYEPHIFDWSFSEREELPVWDPCMWASSYKLGVSGDSVSSFRKSLFEKNCYSRAIWEFLQSTFDRAGIPCTWVGVLFPLFLIKMSVRERSPLGAHNFNNGVWRQKFGCWVENSRSLLTLIGNKNDALS